MINKKIGTLAAAVLAASSAQAAFEVAFVAVDGDGTTYVHDMGNYSNIAPSSITTTFAAESTFDSSDYSWTIVGTTSTSTELVAAPPGGGSAVYADTGIVTLSSGAPSSVSIANHSSLGNEVTGIAGWLSTVDGLASGNSSVLIANDSSDIYTSGQQAAFHSAQMQTGTAGFGTFQLNTMFYSASDSPLAPIDLNGGSVFGVSFDGTTAAVPVPAAAWLFGSALAGLTVVRRRK
jgi:hypothetical protein